MLNPASVVLITGASRGLGRGIALEIAKSGGSAMITFAVHAAAAEETVALCLQNRIDERQRFVAVRADIGSDTDRTSLLEKTLKEFGRLDALVNNAGIYPNILLMNMTQISFTIYGPSLW